MKSNVNGLLLRKIEKCRTVTTENFVISLVAETHVTNESFIKYRNLLTYYSIHPASVALSNTLIIIRDCIKQYKE